MPSSMKRRFRIYCETSFWDRLADPTHPNRRSASYAFLDAILHRHDLYISPLVLEEVDATPDPEERRMIRRRLRRAHPKLVSGQFRAQLMARTLREEGGFGGRILADLTHVGYSIIVGADALVTWDVRGLAREEMRQVVNAYCKRNDLAAPLIGTPPEVAKWLSIAI